MFVTAFFKLLGFRNCLFSCGGPREPLTLLYVLSPECMSEGGAVSPDTHCRTVAPAVTISLSFPESFCSDYTKKK